MAHRIVTEQAVFLSTVRAERGDRRLALAVVAVSALIFLAIVPFAGRLLPPVGAFIPIYQSAIVISDLITAAILCIQFNILRSRALLILGCGYLFTALMAISHALTFPGLFAPAGLLGAGSQSTAWIYVFWHAGFPMAVIAYALLKDRDDAAGLSDMPVERVLGISIGTVVGMVVGLTLLATTGAALLPVLMSGGLNTVVLFSLVLAVLLLACSAIVILWLRPHRTVLDVWLMVVMCAWLFEVTLSALLNGQRFTLGYYAGRIYGLTAASFVLVILLLETGALYAQLAKLFEAEQLERRREAEERRRIFETSLDLILVVDSGGNFVRVSPSSLAILGYRPEEMIGRSAAEFICPGDLERTRNEMQLARRGKQMRNFETQYVHKDRSIVMLAWSGVWSEPEQRHFFIGRDMTEQKRIQRMKDEFIATVSHELRTPVTTIAGPLGLLAGGAAGDLPDPVKRLVAMAHSNSARLARLVDDILDIEKIESGRMPFNFARVEIGPLVERALEANRPLAEKFAVPVRLDGEVPDIAVRADGERLMQVLTNLLSNAVKFSARGQEAVVSVETRGRYVRISVRDHGPGVPSEFDTLIFEKFAQVEATDARQKGGTGLGLSIVKQTIEQLGGSVGHMPATSGGTIFYVEVPRWDAASMPHGGLQLPIDATLLSA
jgi:PAS domain S-box-containing protein